MDVALFEEFRSVAYAQAGIDLRDGKAALVSARVAKRLRALGLTEESQYLEVLRADSTGEELAEFLDVISTNFTSFYREADHFELLAAQASSAVRAGASSLRYWSAASSSGEEPYSMAMAVLDALKDAPVELKLLATDISRRVLRTAQAGVYPRQALAPAPPALVQRYFTRHGSDADQLEVSAVLREVVRFGRLNLSAPPFPMRGPFDAIFCRNVMIYFDVTVRRRLVAELARLLAPGGLLFIGHTETLNGVGAGLEPVQPSVYRKLAEARRG